MCIDTVGGQTHTADTEKTVFIKYSWVDKYKSVRAPAFKCVSLYPTFYICDQMSSNQRVLKFRLTTSSFEILMVPGNTKKSLIGNMN